MMKPELQLNSNFLRTLELQEIQNQHFMLIFPVLYGLSDHRSKELILTRGKSVLYI